MAPPRLYSNSPYNDFYRAIGLGLVPDPYWSAREYRIWLERQVDRGNKRVIEALRDPKALKELDAALKYRYEKTRINVVRFSAFSPGVSEGGRGQGTGANAFLSGDREDYKRALRAAQELSKRMLHRSTPSRPEVMGPQRVTGTGGFMRTISPSSGSVGARLPLTRDPTLIPRVSIDFSSQTARKVANSTALPSTGRRLSLPMAGPPRSPEPLSEWRQKYESYIRSSAWEAKKAQWRSANPGMWKCACCGATVGIQMHHMNYKDLGNEKLEDLLPLCERHHKQVGDYLTERGMPVSMTRQVIGIKGQGMGGGNIANLKNAHYLDVRVPFPNSPYYGKRLDELPASYMSALEGADTWLRVNARVFWNAVKYASGMRWWIDKVTKYHNPDDGLSPADSDYFRDDYYPDTKRNPIQPSRGGRDKTPGEMGVVYVGASPLDYHKMKGPAGNFLGVDIGFSGRVGEKGGGRISYRESPYLPPQGATRSYATRKPKEYDPDRPASQRRRELWDMIGAMPNPSRGWVTGGFRGMGVMGPRWGGQRSVMEAEVERLRARGASKRDIREYKKERARMWYQLNLPTINKMERLENLAGLVERGAGLGFSKGATRIPSYASRAPSLEEMRDVIASKIQTPKGREDPRTPGEFLDTQMGEMGMKKRISGPQELRESREEGEEWDGFQELEDEGGDQKYRSHQGILDELEATTHPDQVDELERKITEIHGPEFWEMDTFAGMKESFTAQRTLLRSMIP